MSEEIYGADGQSGFEENERAEQPEELDSPENEGAEPENDVGDEYTPTEEAMPERDSLEADFEPNYERLIEEDTRELRAKFPELKNLNSVAELRCAMRYAELRDLGLSCEEAYLAARGRVTKKNNRTHLSAALTASASDGASIPRSELIAAREIFPDLSDKELQRLYNRVSG